MKRQLYQSILVGFLLTTTSWAAESFTAPPAELADIADEITALAVDVQQRPFTQRAIVGKDVDVTLPQLADRIFEVEDQLLQEEGTSTHTLDELAAFRWDLQDLESRVKGIDLVRDEATYLLMRQEMQQGLEDLGRRLEVFLNSMRAEPGIFAH